MQHEHRQTTVRQSSVLLPGAPAGVSRREPRVRRRVAQVRPPHDPVLGAPLASRYRRSSAAQLGAVSVHDETTLTRNLRPLVDAGWVAVRAGEDRREKWLRITAGGVAALKRARPAWERAQHRMRSLLPEAVWQNLMAVLPDVARLAAEGDGRPSPANQTHRRRQHNRTASNNK